VADDSEVVTIGETMAMFRAVSSGPLSVDSLFEFGIGGAESNVAIGLRRLGVPTAWLSALGPDAFGSVIRTTLCDEGVRVQAEVDPTRHTGLMFKTPVEGQDPQVQYYRAGSAASALGLSPAVTETLCSARWIHLTGIFPALSDRSRATALDIVDLAVEHSIPFSFDINYRAQLWSKAEARSTLLTIASEAEIVFGGVAELEILVGAHDRESDLLQAIAHLGPPEVVAKLGPDGAMAVRDGRDYAVPAHSVEVVDTVGAGDAFVAGYLSQRLRGEPTDRALARGAICGALACTQGGDWEGAPFLDEVSSFETGVLV
jgi:2-dehydro-3-deoxygluconokinase